MQTYNFVGCHKAVTQKKFSLENSTEYLILSDRLNTEGKKPVSFIVKVDEKGKRTYISSLFPNPDGSFNFDYLGQRYCATITKDSLCCQIRK